MSDYSELYVGHDTWTMFGDMLRVYKHYYFALADTSVSARGMSFSSYPGVLWSIDDFYMLSSGLVVTETTNTVANNAQYSLISESTLLTWLRVRAANFIGTDGKTWTENMQRYWSGTYPNQWIVIDYKLWKPKTPLSTGLLWIMEELPSQTHSGDVSVTLAKGDWRSYNIPYFPDMYVAAGIPERVVQYGPDASYDLAPRAKIMRRDVNNVQDMQSMKYFMRYNDWQYDPYSENDPHNSICARQDLTPGNPLAKGGIDTKITNSQMFASFSAMAISGPTNQNQPTFNWNQFPTVIRQGQPQSFNFPWQTVKPSLWS